MDLAAFVALAGACAPQVHVDTASSVVAVESAFNPYAIGVVGGALERQPRNRAEALATAGALQAGSWNFSVGLAQINVRNLERLGLNLETAFEPCRNLAAMQVVLRDCFVRSALRDTQPQSALRKSLSCYYSGNFSTGFTHGYVRRVVLAATKPASHAPLAPISTPAVIPDSKPIKELQ
jgi:type IV secretion system protein VirB1